MLRMGRPIAIVALLMSCVLLVAACNTTPTTTPTSSAAPSTVTTFISSGVGATKADWERTHQFTKYRADYEYIYGNIEEPFSGYYVLFWQEGGAKPEDRIAAISVDARLALSDTKRIPPVDNYLTKITDEQMDEAVQMFLPADAQLQSKNTYQGSEQFVVEIYVSKSLSTLFAPLPQIGLPWGQDAPGTINVQYERDRPGLSIIAGSAAYLLTPKPSVPPTMTPLLPWPVTIPPGPVHTPPRPLPTH